MPDWWYKLRCWWDGHILRFEHCTYNFENQDYDHYLSCLCSKERQWLK